jgi:hypothetical protein
MMKLLKAALVAATAACALSSAEAATFKPIAKGKSLVMTGQIVAGDAQRLVDAYNASLSKRGYAPKRIFLNSDGGLISAGLEVANKVIESGMHTVIGKTDSCASICVAVFAAGSHKVVFTTSMVGVHSASTFGENEFGEIEQYEATEATVALARIFKDIGVPDSVIAKMVTTKPDEIAWLHDGDWPGVEVLDAGAAHPNNPQPRQDTPEAVAMTCTGDGGQYVVEWRTDGVYFKDRWHAINDAHQHHKTGAYVVTGPTRWGTYGAVFGGPNPRIEFSNGKEVVKDRCW